MSDIVHWIKNHPEHTVTIKHWTGAPDAIHIQVKKDKDVTTLNHLLTYDELKKAKFPEQIIVATLNELAR